MEIVHDDLLDYRDAVAKLPVSMPKTSCRLSFTERLSKHSKSAKDDEKVVARVSPATVKKRVGGIQALLSFAFAQKWTKANVGRDVSITAYTKAPATPRRSFEEDGLRKLFTSSLFHRPAAWR